MQNDDDDCDFLKFWFYWFLVWRKIGLSLCLFGFTEKCARFTASLPTTDQTFLGFGNKDDNIVLFRHPGILGFGTVDFVRCKCISAKSSCSISWRLMECSCSDSECHSCSGSA